MQFRIEPWPSVRVTNTLNLLSTTVVPMYDDYWHYIVHFFQLSALFRTKRRSRLVVDCSSLLVSLTLPSFLFLPLILSAVFLSLLHSHFSSYAGEALLHHLLHWPTLFSLTLSFSICFESCHYSSLLRFLTCQTRRYRLARLVHASSPTPLRWQKKQAWIALTPTWTSPSSSVSTLLEGRSSSLSMFTLLSMIVKPLYE